MAFDWKTIIPVVASVAPAAGSIVGGILGGPLGATIGGKFGSILAEQFGLPATATPGQVSDAIAAAGEETARAKINAAMEIARAQISGWVELEKAELEAVTTAAVATQETMRVEATSNESFFFRGWRPTAAWLYNVMMTVFGVELAWATFKAILVSTDALSTLRDAWPLYLAYLGALAAVNGILIPSRSLDKKTAIENGVPMPNTTITAKVEKPVPSPPKIIQKIFPPQGSGGSRVTTARQD